ncbi:MAG: DUF2254 family protein [Candidatus Methanoperedens sp.]|nr:DUF2254 family protein [Candidatus Methanoperedens sp.]
MPTKILENASIKAKNLLFRKTILCFIGLILFLVYSILFFSFRVMYIDDDSSRYMLSALVQSEASILAIVISLSLVAVQHAASSYSARVIDVFRNKNPYLWILTGIYLLSIIYGLGVLMLIDSTDLANNSLNLQNYITLAYYFGILSFLSLIPYIFKTLDLLKPSTVIGMLAEEMAKKNNLQYISDRYEKSDDKDPIQPIIDIVRGSMMKYDYETVKDGLKAITNGASNIFQTKNFNKNEKEKIAEYIFYHLKRIGKLAVSRKDEDSAVEAIININNVGMSAVQQKLDRATLDAVISLGEVGGIMAEQKLEYATSQAIDSFKWIGMAAAKQHFKDSIEEVATSLGTIGKIAAEQEQRNTVRLVANCLEEIGKVVAEQKLEEATIQIIDSQKRVGILMAELKFDLKEAKEPIKAVLSVAKKQNLLEATNQAAKSINEIHGAFK